MKLSRKTITLPSGGTCQIRPFSGMDFVRSGKLPNILPETKREVAKAASETGVNASQIEQGVAISILALTRCTGPVKCADGQLRKIVDKAFHECTAFEICVEEIEQEDADFIVKAVSEISMMGKETAKQVASFPEEQAADGHASPSGEIIRMHANGPAESVAI